MTTRWMTRTMGLALAAVVGSAAVAEAQWTDRTILKFSDPVMVPGATLQPGAYVFELRDADDSRHVVEIRRQDTSEVITLTQAVPMKRADAKGDVVVKFNPTDAGSPPALKGYFAPGSIYGHEFVYPDAQAKEIASRTKTVVLSVDVPGSDMEKGTLRTYNPSGVTAEWKGDAATMREWETWQRGRSTARASADDAQKPRSTAPVVKGDFQGTRVTIDDLEDNPKQYIGQTVSVDAEVEEVFGPRLFTIDEAQWGDLAGEILVFMPTTMAALVKDDDRVTITGTVKPFVRTEVEREWGWLGLDKQIEVEFSKKPILVASRIVGGDSNTAFVIDLDETGKPVGTSGAGSTGAPVTDIKTLAGGDEDLVGRRVTLEGLQVAGMAKDGGFYVRSGDSRLFVLPAQKDATSVKDGATVSVHGVIMQMPDGMRERLTAGKSTNDEIYVYATQVNK